MATRMSVVGSSGQEFTIEYEYDLWGNVNSLQLPLWDNRCRRPDDWTETEFGHGWGHFVKGAYGGWGGNYGATNGDAVRFENLALKRYAKKRNLPYLQRPWH